MPKLHKSLIKLFLFVHLIVKQFSSGGIKGNVDELPAEVVALYAESNQLASIFLCFYIQNHFVLYLYVHILFLVIFLLLKKVILYNPSSYSLPSSSFLLSSPFSSSSSSSSSLLSPSSLPLSLAFF